MLHDVRFAIRQLRSAPMFAIVAAATLALGIGANSAIFALVDATLLRPLPFPQPDRLVMLWERTETSRRERVAPLNLFDWAERNRTFTRMAAYVPNVGGMVMSNPDGTTENVPRQWVTAGLFEVLGVRPIAGRTFLPEDDERRARVVVLSEGFWRARFNADPALIGRDIRLDGEPYTVVGVAPNESQLLGGTSIWALVSFNQNPNLRRAYGLHAIGRLEPGVALEAARSDLAGVADALARELPDTNTGRGVTIEPLHDALIGGELRQTSMLFLGVVGIVLLICCANVANLLLARATVRTRELAVRSALGATRARVMRQLLTESLVLSAMGGLLGVVLGAAIVDVAPSLVPPGLLPPAVTLTFDTRVAAFCAATALTVGILFGLVPAWQATGVSSVAVLASDSRTTTGGRGTLRSVLVIGEVAIAVVLLVGAGLLLRTLIAVTTVDRGYRADRVLTMLVDPMGNRYPTPAALLQFYDAVAHEVSAVPGVRSVGWASGVPMGFSYTTASIFFEFVGEAPADPTQASSTRYEIVSPGYFDTLDLPLVAGRAFNDRDAQGSTRVCIINEAFVRRYVHGRSPIGLKIAVRVTASAKEPLAVLEIVGVARQVRGRPDETEDVVQMYVPLAQDPIGDLFLFVRSASDSAEALALPVRAAISRIDRDQLVGVRRVMTLDDVASEATARHRFRAVLVVTFAGLALVLAMVGVFGILAYSVQQRMREVGVRRALGASTGDVLRLVIGSGARVVAAGAMLGLVLSTLWGPVLAAMLYGVEPLDPATFATVALVLSATAALSIAGPARRAIRIDPAVALRAD